jgi:hypothetical protein
MNCDETAVDYDVAAMCFIVFPTQRDNPSRDEGSPVSMGVMVSDIGASIEERWD